MIQKMIQKMKQKMKREPEREPNRTAWQKIGLYAVGGVVAGFLNGLFGSGGGALTVPFLEEGLHLDERTSHATAILIVLGFTLVSLAFYGARSFLDYRTAVYASAGGVAGGFFGARLLSRLPGSVIRKVFGVFLAIAGVRMVIA